MALKTSSNTDSAGRTIVIVMSVVDVQKES
jgi:hypothetical protein